jgi:hypothetical protein
VVVVVVEVKEEGPDLEAADVKVRLKDDGVVAAFNWILPRHALRRGSSTALAGGGRTDRVIRVRNAAGLGVLMMAGGGRGGGELKAGQTELRC